MKQNVKKLDIPTKRGTVLDGVLFAAEKTDTVLIAITGIHGNFYSNPFYYNIGDTMNAAGMDFIYAQTNDAFGQIETYNIKTGQKEIIGSWNEDIWTLPKKRAISISSWQDIPWGQTRSFTTYHGIMTRESSVLFY